MHIRKVVAHPKKWLNNERTVHSALLTEQLKVKKPLLLKLLLSFLLHAPFAPVLKQRQQSCNEKCMKNKNEMQAFQQPNKFGNHIKRTENNATYLQSKSCMVLPLPICSCLSELCRPCQTWNSSITSTSINTIPKVTPIRQCRGC